jgi:hypothetical protein
LALAVLLLILIAAADYGLWQEPVRVARVGVEGGDPALASVARSALAGTYLGIVPRDSVFFVPARAIRASILAAHPDIAAVSVRRDGLTGVLVKVSPRVPVARWCGLSPAEGSDERCYLFDGNGFVYAAADASSTPLNPFRTYVPLLQDAAEPLRATIAHANVLPSTFDFARQIGTLGSPVENVVVNGDEVSDLLASGTRITYVLGAEQQAFAALVSAKGRFSLSDGSVDYVDLRFPGKVYLKKKGDDTVSQ